MRREQKFALKTFFSWRFWLRKSLVFRKLFLVEVISASFLVLRPPFVWTICNALQCIPPFGPPWLSWVVLVEGGGVHFCSISVSSSAFLEIFQRDAFDWIRCRLQRWWWIVAPVDHFFLSALFFTDTVLQMDWCGLDAKSFSWTKFSWLARQSHYGRRMNRCGCANASLHPSQNSDKMHQLLSDAVSH